MREIYLGKGEKKKVISILFFILLGWFVKQAEDLFMQMFLLQSSYQYFIKSVILLFSKMASHNTI